MSEKEIETETNEKKLSNDQVYNIVTSQLRRSKITKPRKVMATCKYGFPQVTFAECSLGRKGNKIMPGTLLWLTCPRVRTLVSHLEVSDEFQLMKDEYENGEKKDVLLQSHEKYREFMESELTEEEYCMWLTGNQAKTKDELKDSKVKRHGNAGVSVASSLKCLHAHVASYLAGVDDEVGRDGVQRIAKIELDIEDCDRHVLDCPGDCVQCEQFNPDETWSKKKNNSFKRKNTDSNQAKKKRKISEQKST